METTESNKKAFCNQSNLCVNNWCNLKVMFVLTTRAKLKYSPNQTFSLVK